MRRHTGFCSVIMMLTVLTAVCCHTRDLSPIEPDSTLDSETPDTVQTDTPGEDSVEDVVEDDVITGEVVSDVVGEDGDEAPAWPTGKYISCDEVNALMAADDPDMLLLLVSDEEFWTMGMIEGSVVVPWDLLAGRLGEVDRTRNVVAYCRRGVRSEAAYDTLVGDGYEHVWVMTDGLEEWISLGYPVVDVP